MKQRADQPFFPTMKLLLGILAVWRITHLPNAEDGPWNLFVRLREVMGFGFAGELLDCFYCLSLWIAAPLAYCLGEGWRNTLLLWPALSAGAILAERITIRPQEENAIPRAVYFEEPEVSHVLRQESRNSAERVE